MEGVSLNDPDLNSKLSKSDTLEKLDFEASVNRGVQTVFKVDDEFVIWGPASVEVVDKEGDKIRASALEDALPQLLRRARLSLDHSDQIVGRVLEQFKTEEPVTIEINGQSYERNEFPTDVLDLDDGQPAALYVAGEVYGDSQQAQRARQRIKDGELNSYSISGEALMTRKKVEDGLVYDDVVDMDLSAVTLCEEGMNQGAKYAQIDAEVEDKELAGDVGKSEERTLDGPTVTVPDEPSASTDGPQPSTATVSKTMSDPDNEGEEKSGSEPTIEDVLKRLPEEGEIATKNDLDGIEEKAVKTVKDQLPDGNLATVDAVEQIVEQEVKSYTSEKEEDDRLQ